jgi:2-polyprenyl-3-methyl-5-hydroxy-6-metoxy-1,4-benzoquinol methylase
MGVKNTLKKGIISIPFLYFTIKKIKYWGMGIINGVDHKKILQTASTTEFDRHPDLFKVVSELFSIEPNCRILSFGCSTGKECISLLEYFKNANIVGTDINKKSLKTAHREANNSHIEYLFSNDTVIAKEGPYDIIFALSVLCKNPEAEFIEDISKIYSFKEYEKTILFFDQILKPGGVLVIRSSNFMFKDTSVFKNYKIYKNSNLRTPQLFPKFTSNNIRIPNYLDDEEIFIKQR